MSVKNRFSRWILWEDTAYITIGTIAYKETFGCRHAMTLPASKSAISLPSAKASSAGSTGGVDGVEASSADTNRTTRADWTRVVEERGIPCSPVHSLGEFADHPHTEASGKVLGHMTGRGRDLKGVSAPIRVDGERPKLRRPPPPALGQDSAAILSELGDAVDEIEALFESQVVVAG